jgi:two-component system, NtrC family, sensor kinase
MAESDVTISGPGSRAAPKSASDKTVDSAQPDASKRYFRRLKHGLQIGLLLAYLIPIAILIVFFDSRFNVTVRESSKLHLAAVAESQRNTIDLFLQKRIVNIFNLFHLRDFTLSPSQQEMDFYLSNLVQANDAFVDIGFFNPRGIQVGYAGPYPHLLEKDYSREKWYIELTGRAQSYVVSDLYLGLRLKPHFTIGVKQLIDGNYYVIRTSLDPDKLYAFLQTTSHGKSVDGFLINEEGLYQAVDPEFGRLLEPAVFIPPAGRRDDVSRITINDTLMLVAYAWLKEVPWCLVMRQPLDVAYSEYYSIRNTMIFSTASLVLVIMFIIWFIVHLVIKWGESLERDRAELKSQLYHAHKLVSVGQLAGGVAHEINNPLAIIASEAGLIRDMLDPSMGLDSSKEALIKELDEIDKAVYRAKSITQKILSFVRKTQPQLVPSNVNQLLEDLVSGVKEQEFKVSNINLVRDYDPSVPQLLLDPDLIRQVFLNLVNNASDAVKEGDTIKLSTRLDGDAVRVTVSDTGEGMDPETLEKIFMPFYTSKEVGKGTGLGLPIALNIVEGMGGRMEVRSAPGQGSAFTVVLPVPKASLGQA